MAVDRMGDIGRCYVYEHEDGRRAVVYANERGSLPPAPGWREVEYVPASQPAGAVEALRDVTEALDDAIKCVVNGGEGWTQEDYDRWAAARARGEAARGQ